MTVIIRNPCDIAARKWRELIRTSYMLAEAGQGYPQHEERYEEFMSMAKEKLFSK